MARVIEIHPQSKKLLVGKATTSGLRRTMVMTAVIMGWSAPWLTGQAAGRV